MKSKREKITSTIDKITESITQAKVRVFSWRIESAPPGEFWHLNGNTAEKFIAPDVVEVTIENL